MEKSKINNKRKQPSPDINGNSKSTKLESNNNNNNNNNSKDKNGNKIKIRDEVISSDGRVYYLCRYCNKVFQIKKERTNHLRKCPAKSYILSVADSYDKNDDNKQVQEEEGGEKEALITNNNNNNDDDSKKLDAFDRLLASKTNEIYLNNDKINIKQNIVLKKSKSPIKLTIRRSPSKDGNNETYFTVTENEQTIPPEIDGNNSNNNNTTETINEEKSDDLATKPIIDNNNDKKQCRQCKLTFNNGIDLLRHVRELHKYPKIVMAMSEIKKYYQLKDWTKCPICTKPLTKNYRSAYLRHLNTHANELEFSCNICGRKFRRADHMKEHAKRHIIENQTNDD